MANPVCTQATLIEGATCLRNFNLHDRKALKVYFMVKQLQAIGGTNYSSGLGPAGSLNTAASAYCGLQADLNLLRLAYLVIEKNNALEAGATISSSNAVLTDEIKCLRNFPDWKLNLMEILLRCQIGRAQSYPQT